MVKGCDSGMLIHGLRYARRMLSLRPAHPAPFYLVGHPFPRIIVTDIKRNFYPRSLFFRPSCSDGLQREFANLVNVSENLVFSPLLFPILDFWRILVRIHSGKLNFLRSSE